MKTQYALKIRQELLTVVLVIALLPLIGIAGPDTALAQADTSLAGTTWEETRDSRWSITLDEAGSCRIDTPRGKAFGRWEKTGNVVEFHAVTPEGRANYRCTLNGDVCYGTATAQELRGILSLRKRSNSQ